MDYVVMETQLSGEYREVFSKAVLYSTMKSIPEDICDDRLIELYDLLITAESEEKPVQKLIGKDTNRFYRDFFDDLTVWERLKYIPKSIYNMMWFVFIIECIQWLASDNAFKDFFIIRSDISGYGIGVAIAVLMYFITSSIFAPILLKKKNKSGIGWYILVIALFVLLVGLGVYFFGDYSVLVPIHSVVLASGFYIFFYIVVRSIWRLKNYGSLRNTKKQLEQSGYYKNLENKDIENAILKGWKSRYAMLSKRGKVTEESYLQKLCDEEQLSKKITSVGIPVVFVVLTVFAIIQTALTSTWYDTLIFAIIICVVEFFIGRWTLRSEKKQSAIRSRMPKECESKGMTLPDYISERLGEQKKQPECR